MIKSQRSRMSIFSFHLFIYNDILQKIKDVKFIKCTYCTKSKHDVECVRQNQKHTLTEFYKRLSFYFINSSVFDKNKKL